MHDQKFIEVLGRHFSLPEVQQIVKFLDRGFSPQGEVTLVGIFIYAGGMQKKPLQEIFNACEEEWLRNWSLQDTEVRGDPEAPGGLRSQNVMSSVLIYLRLKIPNPGV